MIDLNQRSTHTFRVSREDTKGISLKTLGLKTLKVTCDQTSAKLTLTYWQESAYQKNEEIPFGFGEWIEKHSMVPGLEAAIRVALALEETV